MRKSDFAPALNKSVNTSTVTGLNMLTPPGKNLNKAAECKQANETDPWHTRGPPVQLINS